MFQQLEQTLLGLPVIRAFGRQASFKGAFNRKLALSTSVAWCKTALDQWLLIRLTFICCSVVFGTAIFVVFYADVLNVALVGTVISSALNLTSELR